jgi:hypothetical protein
MSGSKIKPPQNIVIFIIELEVMLSFFLKIKLPNAQNNLVSTAKNQKQLFLIHRNTGYKTCLVKVFCFNSFSSSVNPP